MEMSVMIHKKTNNIHNESNNFLDQCSKQSTTPCQFLGNYVKNMSDRFIFEVNFRPKLPAVLLK